MSFQELAAFLPRLTLICGGGFLATIAAAVAFQLLTGRINMQGLLRDKTNGQPSPGRVQLLLITLAVAGAYLGAMLGAAPIELFFDKLPGRDSYHGLPELKGWVVELLGGSSVTYASGKALPILQRVVERL